MIFDINGLKLGNSRKIGILSPIKGLEVASLRVGEGNWSGKDGGYISSQFYGSRLITIAGVYQGDSCEDADNIRNDISDALKIRQSLPTFITSFSGKKYFTQAYLRDFKMDLIGSKHGEFQITLLCPDPLLYDAGDGSDPDSGWQEQDVYKLVGGGYITAYDMPVPWTLGTTPTVITNAGDAYIYPQIKIEGKVTNPIITNVTENKFVKINVTTSSTDELIIDLNERIVTLNGSSILSYRTLDSSWWGLSPGGNTINYVSSDDTDVNHVTVRWRNGYTGI